MQSPLHKSSKQKKRRASTGSIDEIGLNTNRSRQSGYVQHSETINDIPLTTLNPEFDSSSADFTSDLDSQSSTSNPVTRNRSNGNAISTRQRRIDEVQPSKTTDNISSTIPDPNFDPQRSSAQLADPLDRLEQMEKRKWIRQFLASGGSATAKIVKRLPPNAPEINKSIYTFQADSAKVSKDYKFVQIDEFLEKFPPRKPPEIYIVEGDYPNSDDNRSEIHGIDLAAELSLKVEVDRSLDRVKDRMSPPKGFTVSDLDERNHGITVGSLVHHNYTQASVRLDVAYGHPAKDWGLYDILTDDKIRSILSGLTFNITFQSYFDKLLKNGVKDSVINLSQMVKPHVELTELTVQRMEELARQNNVIVLALGNQTARSDNTPAYQLLHAAIDRINKDPQSTGTIVLVENLENAWDSGLQKGKATLIKSSNFIKDPTKKTTTLAVRGGGSTPEVRDQSTGAGEGTSWSAPKLSAMISKLTTAVTSMTGQPVKTKDVVAALVETADLYEVTKSSKLTDAGEEIPEDVLNPADIFTINVPNGDKALKLLLTKANIS